jgi:Putative zinc-finger
MEENSFMASRERDDATAGLLKRTLAGDAGDGNGCPEPDILAAYFERSLDADETAHVELHLSECARCREQLVALGRAEEAADMPPGETLPRLLRPSWIWDWRWLAPVAAVLILTAVWATRRPALTEIARHATQSATASREPAQTSAPEEKEERPSRLAAPAPNAAPETPEPASAANTKTRAEPANRPSAPVAKPAAPSENALSAGNLAVPARSLAARDALSKKVVAPRKSLPEQTANARMPGANEAVAVESAAPAAATPQTAPASGAPMAAGTGRGNDVGVAGGVASGPVAADSAKAKEQPVASNGLQSQAEIATTTQEQLSASFIVRTPDKSVLWRIGSSGFVERSGDGGLTWNGTLPKQNAHYAAGSAPSAKVCWLVANDGIILLTQDAANWQTIPPPIQTNFVAVVARDAWTATVTTADGRKFTTTNQGERWTPAK